MEVSSIGEGGREVGGRSSSTVSTVNRQGTIHNLYLIYRCALPHINLQTIPSSLALYAAASSCVDESEQLVYEMSSFAGYHGNSQVFTNQLIRCHALVVGEAGEVCVRANTLPSYTEVNRLVSRLSHLACHCPVA